MLRCQNAYGELRTLNPVFPPGWKRLQSLSCREVLKYNNWVIWFWKMRMNRDVLEVVILCFSAACSKRVFNWERWIVEFLNKLFNKCWQKIRVELKNKIVKLKTAGKNSFGSFQWKNFFLPEECSNFSMSKRFFVNRFVSCISKRTCTWENHELHKISVNEEENISLKVTCESYFFAPWAQKTKRGRMTINVRKVKEFKSLKRAINLI